MLHIDFDHHLQAWLGVCGWLRPDLWLASPMLGTCQHFVLRLKNEEDQLNFRLQKNKNKRPTVNIETDCRLQSCCCLKLSFSRRLHIYIFWSFPRGLGHLAKLTEESFATINLRIRTKLVSTSLSKEPLFIRNQHTSHGWAL